MEQQMHEQEKEESTASSNKIGTVKAMYGVREIDLPLAGKKVSEVVADLKAAVNAPSDAQIMLDGKEVKADSDAKIKEGSTIEFLKFAGMKG